MTQIEQDQRDLLLERTSEAARRAGALGAGFADISVSWGRHINVAVEANDIRLCEQHERWSCSARAFVDGGMGLSGGEGLPTPDALRDRLSEAVEMARLTTADPDFRDLPCPADPVVPNNALQLHDPAIAAITLADAVRLARENIDRALAIDPDICLSGDVSFSVGFGLLASSSGVAIITGGTFGEVSLFAVARDGDDVGSYSEFTMARHWDDLNIEPLARIVVEGARRYQHARPTPARPMSLVLSPTAAWSLLGAVTSATSAESIRRKRSLLAGRLGQPIASPLLTLIDQPLVPRGVHSGAFDSEGAPRQAVTMVDRGVFAEALTNHYNARLAGVSNNGHGTRRGGVSPTNLHIQPGDRPAAEIIAEVDDGIYLHSGSLEPDLASGDISTVLDFAFKIDRGELTYPLAGAMAVGNLLEVLGRIDAVSSDCRADPGLILPTVRIADVQISGGA